MRKVGQGLGAATETIECQIAEALGITDASTIIGERESAAFGGTVRAQMQNEVHPEKRYFGSLAGMGWVSHGSVLAIRELARSVRDAGPDLLRRAVDDENGNDWLHHAAWIMLKLAGLLQLRFGIEVQGMQTAAARIIAANDRLGIISKAQEAAAADALAKHETKKSKSGDAS